MAEDTLTLALNGDVLFTQFADTMQHLNRLIVTLTDDIAGKKTAISWTLDSLAFGSCVATARGAPQEQDDPQSVRRVVGAYTQIGRALKNDEPIPYSRTAVREAQSIKKVLTGEHGVDSIQFETAEETTSIVRAGVNVLPLPAYISAYGAVEGRVQTLTTRRGLRFVLYDALFDRPVSCYLDEGQQDRMRDIWGRRAIIEGWVSRDPVSGRPVAIRRISNNITVLADVVPGQYEQARGILASSQSETSAEDRIRLVRDAW